MCGYIIRDEVVVKGNQYKNGMEQIKSEGEKIKAETKAAESAKKAEAEDVLKKLLASGVSADDILAKLK